MKIYNVDDQLAVNNPDEVRREMVPSFGKQIRAVRLRKGISQEQLAEAAEISSVYIGEIERSEKICSALVMFKLARALRVPVCEFLPAAHACPCTNDGLVRELAQLFGGNVKKREKQKALRLMRVFFDDTESLCLRRH